MELLRRLYAPDYMLKPAQKLSDRYDTSEFYKTFLKVAWPAVAESVLVGLVGFVDTVMVSSMGHTATAAVGLTGQPRLVFMTMFLALNVSITAIVSRRRGENRREDANHCLAQAVSLCILMSLLLVTAAYIFAEPLLRFAGAMDDTLPDAMVYFRIIMIGMLFQSISLAINAAQRGAGNTRISMITNVIANIINCIFNALLINGLFFFPRLGVVGAAIATMIGNIAACGISVASVLKKDQFLQLHFSRLFRFQGENLKLILRIGSSAIVDQVFLRIGFFMISKLVAELGTLEYATHTICMSICSLSFCVGDGLSVASSALVGQNLGRKRPDHSIIYGKTGQRIGFLVALVLFVLFTACGRWIIQLFMTDEAEAEQILEIGAKLLVVLAFISPAQISQVVFIGCLRGAGDVKFTATVSLICVAVLRPVLTYLLCYIWNFGVIGAWIAMLIDQYTRLVLNALRFSGGKWAKIVV